MITGQGLINGRPVFIFSQVCCASHSIGISCCLPVLCLSLSVCLSLSLTLSLSVCLSLSFSIKDFTVFGGSLSSMHARKICKVSLQYIIVHKIFMSKHFIVY